MRQGTVLPCRIFISIIQNFIAKKSCKENLTVFYFYKSKLGTVLLCQAGAGKNRPHLLFEKGILGHHGIKSQVAAKAKS